MGATFIPLVLFMGGLYGGMLTYEYTQSLLVSVPAGAISAVLALALFAYSPIPNHNGGFGLPPAKWQKWGFTDEPAGEYEEPTAEEVMRPALAGVKMAKRREKDDGN